MTEAIAPRLWDYEVRNSVLMGMRRGRITQTDAKEFLKSLSDLNVALFDPVSYGDIFSLADRYKLTYDAAYLDLAMKDNSPIASLDKELIQAAGKSGVTLFKA